mmetsp:Transcript_45606/g.108524  ORF Transcript_45606/g.108524 Transcript_45606/m.108524 type:complete len:433 (+) Transcript_45606:72-1370(+)
MSPGPVMALRAGEEEWREVFERLQERFPTVQADKVAQVLRENNGHAGNAAGALRHLTGDGVAEPEADDAEHVATLLSSPAMFKHVCKEHFKKFDLNGDGILQFSEVLGLTNALYQNFGLQQPSEGSLRAFFDATDENNDGVLSEREFRKFFECFLRYAYFDVVKLRQLVQKGLQKRASSKELGEKLGERPSPPSSAEDTPAARSQPEPEPPKKPRNSVKVPDATEESMMMRPQRSKDSQDGSDAHSNGNHHHHHHHHSAQPRQQLLRCISDSGVAVCRTPSLNDATGTVIRKGQNVPVLEMWVKTADGWLPISDPNGGVLFDRAHDPAESGSRRSRGERHHGSEARGTSAQRSHSQHHQQPPNASSDAPAAPARSVSDKASAGKLAEHEADWQERFERLKERFPQCSAAQVLAALRQHEGHAGQAAATLREL